MMPVNRMQQFIAKSEQFKREAKALTVFCKEVVSRCRQRNPRDCLQKSLRETVQMTNVVIEKGLNELEIRGCDPQQPTDPVNFLLGAASNALKDISYIISLIPPEQTGTTPVSISHERLSSRCENCTRLREKVKLENLSMELRKEHQFVDFYKLYEYRESEIEMPKRKIMQPDRKQRNGVMKKVIDSVLNMSDNVSNAEDFLFPPDVDRLQNKLTDLSIDLESRCSSIEQAIDNLDQLRKRFIIDPQDDCIKSSPVHSSHEEMRDSLEQLFLQIFGRLRLKASSYFEESQKLKQVHQQVQTVSSSRSKTEKQAEKLRKLLQQETEKLKEAEIQRENMLKTMELDKLAMFRLEQKMDENNAKLNEMEINNNCMIQQMKRLNEELNETAMERDQLKIKLDEIQKKANKFRQRNQTIVLAKSRSPRNSLLQSKDCIEGDLTVSTDKPVQEEIVQRRPRMSKRMSSINQKILGTHQEPLNQSTFRESQVQENVLKRKNHSIFLDSNTINGDSDRFSKEPEKIYKSVEKRQTFVRFQSTPRHSLDNISQQNSKTILLDKISKKRQLWTEVEEKLKAAFELDSGKVSFESFKETHSKFFQTLQRLIPCETRMTASRSLITPMIEGKRTNIIDSMKSFNSYSLIQIEKEGKTNKQQRQGASQLKERATAILSNLQKKGKNQLVKKSRGERFSRKRQAAQDVLDQRRRKTEFANTPSETIEEEADKIIVRFQTRSPSNGKRLDSDFELSLSELKYSTAISARLAQLHLQQPILFKRIKAKLVEKQKEQQDLNVAIRRYIVQHRKCSIRSELGCTHIQNLLRYLDAQCQQKKE